MLSYAAGSNIAKPQNAGFSIKRQITHKHIIALPAEKQIQTAIN